MISSICKRCARCCDSTALPSSSSLICRTSIRSGHESLSSRRPYSSATKRVEASAMATATLTLPVHDFQPQYASAHDPLSSRPGPGTITNFLRKRAQEPLILIPAPLPDDVQSTPLNDYFFPDTNSQDLLAVMDTCLNDCYDVPRARDIFELTRKQQRGRFLLQAPIFNKFLLSYGTMAARHEQHREEWLHEAWVLFNRMQNGEENAQPNTETYVIMTLLWKRHEQESKDFPPRFPEDIVRMVLNRGISLPSLLPHCSLIAENEQEQEELVRLISRTVASMGLPLLVREFTQAVSENDVNHAHDHLDGVPAVRPVVRLRRRDTVENEVVVEDDGSYTEVKPSGDGKQEVLEIPYNIWRLRDSLKNISTSHKTLGDDLRARQQLMEQSVYDVAVDRLKHEHRLLEKVKASNLGAKPLRALMWDWHQKLTARLQDDITVLVREEAATPPDASNRSLQNLRLGSFVSLLGPDKLSLIAILEIMSLQGAGGIEDGMKITRALLSVGRAVEDEYKAETSRRYGIPLRSYTPGIVPRASSYFSPVGYEVLHARRIAARQELETAESLRAPWSHQVRLKVGSFLVDCLMDVATVTRYARDRTTGEMRSEEQPAFSHAIEYFRGQRLGVIKLNPAVASRVSRDRVIDTIHPRQLPMIIKPRAWLDVDDGGYLTSRTSVMRYKDSVEQAVYLQEASAQGKLEYIYAGLDVLSSTPWQINEDIFKVVIEVWNSGRRFCKIPPAVYEEPEPTMPPEAEKNSSAKATYNARVREWANDKANCHSDRCSINYKLEIARAFLGELFYFPHNVDFRGRAYPVPPHFNHMGDDLSRGLLKFGESRPLGESGLRWLKIHLSNLYGFDKASFSERVAFTMSHLDDIYDSAENPLTGRQWWTKADDPWQCLAACIELRNALESPDPLMFESMLPVHQDGTCNGLQHYAALGGDRQGAAQVNLDVTDRPSDVYTFVANMLDNAIAKDVEQGVEEAKLIQGKITRKVVKQTVMTTVYGVTFIGAREQIEKQLREKPDIVPEMRFKISAYVAKQTLAAIGDLFNGARAIQTWFTLTARLIARSIPSERMEAAKSFGSTSFSRGGKVSRKDLASNRIAKEQMTSVIWTTALGLPIVQPYRKTKRRQVMTKLQSVYISDPNAPTEVNAAKQASAFPPNFVHSLDATHMMLTALECRSQDITFAAVHDSYWTHASTVDAMSQHIRSTFIELHSSDVLERLESEFRERYADHKLPLKALFSGKFLKALREAGCDINLPKHIEQEARSQAAVDRKQRSNDDSFESEEDENEGLPEDQPDDYSPFPVDKTPMREQFVNVVDLFPPLPRKGDFEVRTVRDSLYFFS